MKNTQRNRRISRILKSALLCGLLVGTVALAAPPSSNPIQSFTASPSTITAGQTTLLTWVVEGTKDVTLSGVSATPASSAVVGPTHTTTYTLTARTTGNKFESKEVTINVAADPSIANAVIDPTQAGYAVPPGYIGFYHEWGQAQLLMGDPAIGTNPIYRQLLDNLTAYGGGPISIRIGGSSTDTQALPDASTVSPFAALFKDQRRADGVFFYLGVNLGSDVVALATSQAQVFVQNMPKRSIRAIEIGNEPDFYPIVSHHRPSTYDYPAYAEDFLTWRKSILAVLPNGPLVHGPSDASYPALPISGGTVSTVTTYLTPANMSSFVQQERFSRYVVHPPTPVPSAERNGCATCSLWSVASRVPWQFDGLAYPRRSVKLSWPLHLALLSLSRFDPSIQLVCLIRTKFNLGRRSTHPRN